MEQLVTAQRAAHAAWASCPDGKKFAGQKAELAAALTAICGQVAAAKRAAAPVEKLDLAAELAKLGQKRVAAEIDAAFRAASLLYHEAYEYPRQGEGWPMDRAECEAQATLRAGFASAGMVGEDVYGNTWGDER